MRSAKSLIVLLATTTLAACATGPAGPITARSNPSPYSVHQPVVQRTDYVLDLDAAGDSLSASERARLAAWIDTLQLRYGDRLYVEESSAYPSPGARSAVAEVFGPYGLLLQPGAPVLAGEVAPGTVRVIASRTTASVPGCPEWGDSQIAPTVTTSANYGCATNSNLASMIADPNDLIEGRSGSVVGNTTVAGRAVRVYRERAPSGSGNLPSTSTRGN